MKCFISFSFMQGAGETCQGRVIVDGVPQSTEKLAAIEAALLEGLEKGNPGVYFSTPTIIAVNPLPESKPEKKNGSGLIIRR